MQQAVTANDILTALNKDGRVSLYINFDTGKSSIKPDSQGIIQQMVELMNQNLDLKLTVEGHTDNVGKPEANKLLSEQRAKAVVQALVKEGIDQKRLKPVGYGQEKPVADNSTPEGRAKNRRVELVK
jgi:outer membrane protein OmpA-like peptidoglycan-associated protein